MSKHPPSLISVDYLEMLCQFQGVAISCGFEEKNLWITALGPHPSNLTLNEVNRILRDSTVFEILKFVDEENYELHQLKRAELEHRLRKMVN